jgi:hypothetical protein
MMRLCDKNNFLFVRIGICQQLVHVDRTTDNDLIILAQWTNAEDMKKVAQLTGIDSIKFHL